MKHRREKKAAENLPNADKQQRKNTEREKVKPAAHGLSKVQTDPREQKAKNCKAKRSFDACRQRRGLRLFNEIGDEIQIIHTRLIFKIPSNGTQAPSAPSR